MAPPVFKDVGKKARDTLKKDFVSEHEVEAKVATTNGLTFTTIGKRNGTGFDLDFEAEYNDKPAGFCVKEKLSSSNDMTLEVSLSNKIVDGMKVSVESVTNTGAPKSIKAGIEYCNKNTATVVTADLQKLTFDASTVFAYENFLVGAKTVFDSNKGSINGADCVAQFSSKDFTVSAGVNSSTDEVAATYVHNLSNVDATVAGTYTFNTSKGTNTFAVGGVYKCDKTSSVKAKIESSGNLSLLYQQKMNNNLTLGLGTTIKTSQLGAANSQSLGVSLKYNSE
jgi:voltage-dependent anion channel protein 2